MFVCPAWGMPVCKGVIPMISKARTTLTNLSKICFTSLGTLIRDLQTEQDVSSETLCSGLCSESTLDRIKNNTLTPSILLAGALLNRLGICEQSLIRYGDPEEQEILRLKYELLSYSDSTSQDYLKKLARLRELCEKSTSPYLKQTYLLFYLRTLPQSSQKQAQTFAALRLTLRDFDPEKMDEYRLTCNERILVRDLL